MAQVLHVKGLFVFHNIIIYDTKAFILKKQGIDRNMHL